MGAFGLGGLLALSGCGGSGSPQAGAVVPAPGPATGGFEDVVAAVQRAKIALCEPAEGGAFIPLPAPPAESAAAATYFRYLEGRIYQFGPCEAPANRRNELRVFRYGEAQTRDAAIRDMALRHLRPTSAFAVGDTYDAQIWSPDPSLEGPVGRAAAAVHVAISRVELARHLDVGEVAAAPVTSVALSSSCPREDTAGPRLDIAGFGFCPATRTVAIGTEVTWTNADLAAHTVTYDGPDGPVDSGSMAQGQSWSTRFVHAGTYQYYCRFHPGMAGTIVVGPAS